MVHSGRCDIMRMIHRAGLLIPENAFYLFKDGLINGVSWTGSAQGYSSYEITDHIHVRAYLWSGVTGTGSSSVITQHLDLRGFKHVHFKYSSISVYAGECPNIRVYPNYVSTPSEGEGPWIASYDLSALADLTDVMLMIQSGHLNKQTSSGVQNASITVREVWATRD